jgi:RNA polymerase sigma-70 factor (ECF subfamily)
MEASKGAAGLRAAASATLAAFNPAAESELGTMEEAAFRVLYERTSRSLFAYLWRVSGHRELAEDLLQEAYCRLLAADLRAMDQGQLKSYLFKIAANLLRDHWRRQKHLAEDVVADHGHDRRSPEAATDLRSAFGQLKPRQRQLLWLAYVEGANHREIADATGLRRASIRLLLFRARRKLAELLRGGDKRGPEVNL